MFKSRLRQYSKLFLISLLFAVYSNSICAGQSEEFIRDGGFELGIADVDIVRFPRYLLGEENKVSPLRVILKNLYQAIIPYVYPE